MNQEDRYMKLTNRIHKLYRFYGKTIDKDW